MQEFKKDNLLVNVLPNRRELGVRAAQLVTERIIALTAGHEKINIIFAAAPSQNEFLAALITNNAIDWSKINAFHMDEYRGLPAGAPQCFGTFLRERLFDKRPFASVNYLNGNSPDINAECERYSNLLKENPPDIVCMGIGENTHVAFNDPPVADFNDPVLVKQVTLDLACRQQQVNDGCFATLTDVPQTAITLTIPALLQAANIFCMVPGKTKTQAIEHTLNASVSEQYPSTILRTHPNAILFVDNDSDQTNLS